MDDPLNENDKTMLAAMIPQILRMAKLKLRYLASEERSEAIADIVCAVAIAYARKVKAGENNFTASTLVNFAHKQWRVGRRAAVACNVNDAMSPKARLRSHGLTSESFETDRDPAGIVERKLDYEQWRATLSAAPMAVCDMLADGYRPSEVADCRGISRGRVSQVRDELAQSWDDMFGGEL